MRTLELYVDGSYNKEEPNITKGAAVILEDNKLLICQRFITNQKKFVDMWNVGGELFSVIGGLILVKGVIDTQNAVVVKIYHDYLGIRSFIKGEWKAKKPGAQMYVSMIHNLKQSMPNVEFEFYKVKAHTGIKWNEFADRIANGNIPPECILHLLPEYRED